MIERAWNERSLERRRKFLSARWCTLRNKKWREISAASRGCLGFNARQRTLRNNSLAEREGFEPPVHLRVLRISSAARSTTLPPLRVRRRGLERPPQGRRAA
jgi:hypothetical protein